MAGFVTQAAGRRYSSKAQTLSKASSRSYPLWDCGAEGWLTFRARTPFLIPGGTLAGVDSGSKVVLPPEWGPVQFMVSCSQLQTQTKDHPVMSLLELFIPQFTLHESPHASSAARLVPLPWI